MLETKGYVTWSSTDDIPDEFANQVTNLVAAARVDESGVSTERYQRIMGAALNAVPSIVSMKSGKRYSPYEVTDY